MARRFSCGSCDKRDRLRHLTASCHSCLHSEKSTSRRVAGAPAPPQRATLTGGPSKKSRQPKQVRDEVASEVSTVRVLHRIILLDDGPSGDWRFAAVLLCEKCYQRWMAGPASRAASERGALASPSWSAYVRSGVTAGQASYALHAPARFETAGFRPWMRGTGGGGGARPPAHRPAQRSGNGAPPPQWRGELYAPYEARVGAREGVAPKRPAPSSSGEDDDREPAAKRPRSYRRVPATIDASANPAAMPLAVADPERAAALARASSSRPKGPAPRFARPAASAEEADARRPMRPAPRPAVAKSHPRLGESLRAMSRAARQADPAGRRSQVAHTPTQMGLSIL